MLTLRTPVISKVPTAPEKLTFFSILQQKRNVSFRIAQKLNHTDGKNTQ